jgi:hypothetical protein
VSQLLISVHGTDPKDDPDCVLNARNITTVANFLALATRLLAGDPYILNSTTDYLFLGNLSLYDTAFGNPSPDYFRNFSRFDTDTVGQVRRVYNLTASLPVNGTTAFDKAKIDAAGLNSTYGDPNTLPFSLDVTFWNPTKIELISLGYFVIQFNYTNVAIANVTVLNMKLRPKANTTIRVFGYLRKVAGFEHVLETELPNALLKGDVLIQSFNS